MRKVISINGSPKGNKATSYAILEHINEKISSVDKKIYSLRSSKKNGYKKIVEEITRATDVIIAFPLYVDCIPALLQDFMEKYNEAYDNRKIKGKKDLHIIINCGFPEPEHNMVAIDIMKEFARLSGFNWRTGVGIGMGGMVNPDNIPPTVNIVRPVYEKLYDIVEGINGDYPEKEKGKIHFTNPHIRMLGRKIMKVFYIFMGNRGWKSQARKNNVGDRLGSRPYI